MSELPEFEFESLGKAPILKALDDKYYEVLFRNMELSDDDNKNILIKSENGDKSFESFVLDCDELTTNNNGAWVYICRGDLINSSINVGDPDNEALYMVGMHFKEDDYTELSDVEFGKFKPNLVAYILEDGKIISFNKQFSDEDFEMFPSRIKDSEIAEFPEWMRDKT
jgi:hypothetical protein